MTDADTTTNGSEPVEGKKKTPRAKKVKTEGDKPKVSRPRLPKFPDEHVITVLKPDIKSGKSAERYNVYQTGMTIKQYVDIMTSEPWNRTEGETWGDIRWDADETRRLIHVGETVIDIPPPPPPKEPKPRKRKLQVVEGGTDQPPAA